MAAVIKMLLALLTLLCQASGLVSAIVTLQEMGCFALVSTSTTSNHSWGNKIVFCRKLVVQSLYSTALWIKIAMVA